MVTKTDVATIATVMSECMLAASYHPPLEMRARQTALTEVCDMLASKFEVMNPRFDKRRFLEKCGVM